MPSGKKKTHEEFIGELRLLNPSSKDFVVLDRYTSNVSKIRCECKLCGRIWTTTPKQLIKGKQKCPYCSKANRPITHEEFLERVKKNNPYYDKFIFLSRYIGVSKKIKLQCKECGHVWETRPFDLANRGINCPSCSGNVTMTESAFRNKLILKNKYINDIELLSPYMGVFKRIDCKCKICGHTWSPMATSLLQGSGCPECAVKRIALTNTKYLDKARETSPVVIPMTNEEYLEKLKENNRFFDKIEFLSKYEGSRNKIKCRCRKCGNEWETSPYTLMRGSGCPECAHTSTSFMEQFLFKSLSLFLNNFKVLNRDKETIGKELDIVVPDKKLAIEIGSWKWHKDVYENDLVKIALCEEKGFKLIIIYDLFTNDINIESNYIWTYEYDLSCEKDYTSLKEIVHKILLLFGYSKTITEEQWNLIIEYAYKHSQRVDYDEFMERFKEENDDYENIEIISKYTKLSAKVKCRCRKCGHTWNVVAFDLLRNSGCIRCRMKELGISRRKASLIAEWRKKNPKGNKKQCHLETGISYVTVLKWWDANGENK